MVGHSNVSNDWVWEFVLVDLNTQHDFLAPQGMCQVHKAAELTWAIRRVIAWAKWHCVPVISSIDSHRGAENTHDGFPKHCIDGSVGQRKLPFTLLGSRIRVEADNTLTLPADLFQRYQQVIFRKRTHDLLCNPKADRFLTDLQTQEYLLFGVGLEYSIKALALGLLARKKKVVIVCDGCGAWNSAQGKHSLRLMQAKGAEVVDIEELLTRRPNQSPVGRMTYRAVL